MPKPMSMAVLRGTPTTRHINAEDSRATAVISRLRFWISATILDIKNPDAAGAGQGSKYSYFLCLAVGSQGFGTTYNLEDLFGNGRLTCPVVSKLQVFQ